MNDCYEFPTRILGLMSVYGYLIIWTETGITYMRPSMMFPVVALEAE